MSDRKKILVIDDEISVCTLLKNFFNKKGFDTVSANSGKEAITLLKQETFDLIITDYFLQDTNGIDLYKEIKGIDDQVIVIFISGYSDLRIAVELLRMGAYHYLAKPLMPDEILKIVQEAIERKPIAAIQNHNSLINPEPTLQDKPSQSHEHKNQKQHITPDKHTPQGIIIGTSEAAKKLHQHIMLVAPTNMTVVIYGATGTGKESVARRIHLASKRHDKPFIPIDCGSLSKELAASELFGYEKGAFTGANAMKTGAFEQAHGGTIFLDEIGNLSIEVQMYLLRAIQEKKVRRVGAVKTQEIDVRIVVASNEDLLHKVSQGTFREDLYYRLNEYSLTVPLLKERQEDIPLLIKQFTNEICEEWGTVIPPFSSEVMEYLMSYDYPGNIRQLKNIIKRICLLAQEADTVIMEHLPEDMFIYSNAQAINLKNPIQNQALEDNYAEFYSLPQEVKVNSKPILDGGDYRNSILNHELAVIMQTLQQTNHNKSKAARILNIDRKTLYNKLALIEKLNQNSGTDR